MMKFNSKYGAGEIDAPKYFAETMCERQAAPEQLCYRFWQNEPWKTKFLVQLRHAHSLLKVYKAEAIWKALQNKRGRNIYSLTAKWLIDLIVEEQAMLDKNAIAQDNAMKTEVEEIKRPETNLTAPSFQTNKSKASKLRDC